MSVHVEMPNNDFIMIQSPMNARFLPMADVEAIKITFDHWTNVKKDAKCEFI